MSLFLSYFVYLEQYVFLFTSKLFLKWSKFLCNLSAWGSSRIETTSLGIALEVVRRASSSSSASFPLIC